MHRHDYVTCRCPHDSGTQIAVDGGIDYFRMVYEEQAIWTRFSEEFQKSWPLEHSEIMLTGVHSDTKCEGRSCTIHNRTNHSRRSWRQVWDGRRGMRRISPATGRSYRDPDER